jgi:cell division initiation protein
MLTPLDIHNQEFRRVLRGYSEDEVDDFLDRVVADFETLLKENAQLKAQVEELRGRVEQYRQLENTLHNALIVAQETAEEVKAAARKEAQLIVREAEEEAARRIRAAEQRVRDIEEYAAQLQREVAAFRAHVRSQLEAHLELLRTDVPVLGALVGRKAALPGPETGEAGDTQVVTRPAAAGSEARQVS